MWPLIAAGAAIAGGITKVIGGVKSGNAARDAAEYNAKLANQNAEETLKLGAEEERRVRVIARKQIGQSRASIGASGVQLDGSALDVLQESAANAELDALGVRYQTYQRYQSFRHDAALSRMSGAAAKSSSMWGAAGSILTGVSQIAGYAGSGSSSLPSEGPSGSSGGWAGGSGGRFSSYA